MLLVPTSVRPSPLHGNGLFATDPISAGAPVWRFVPAFDRIVNADDITRFPLSARKHVFNCWGATGTGWILFGDHAGFINHSAEANLTLAGNEILAVRDISAGDELTLNYPETDFSGVK